MWYKITAERIANIGRLNVRKVKPIYDRPEYRKWVVAESSSGKLNFVSILSFYSISTFFF
jgi:hypothetical protein